MTTMKHDTYHRYAALFDAAHSAPASSGMHLDDDLRVPTGDVAGAGLATAREQEIGL